MDKGLQTTIGQDGLTGQSPEQSLVGNQSQDASLSVELYVNGHRVDQGAGAIAFQPGETLLWSYHLTNTGTTTLSQNEIMVTDSYANLTPQLDTSRDVGGDQLLAPGEVWVYTTTATAEELTTVIDFDVDGAGETLNRGTTIDGQYAEYGLTISTPDHDYGAMIFDSNRPTGGDWDLATPNSPITQNAFNNGEGHNNFPDSNRVPLSSVLIISEDGDQQDPDDNAQGGTLRFDWDSPVQVTQVGILDIDAGESDGNVTAYGADGGSLEQVAIAPLGNNTVQQVGIGQDGVSRLDVNLQGSGAVYEIEFERWFKNTVQITAGGTILVEAGCYQNEEPEEPVPLPLPDLSIDDVIPTDGIVNGQSLALTGAVTATVTNESNLDVIQPFDILFFEDTNANQTYDQGTDNVLGETSVTNPLASGDSQQVTAELAGTVSFSGVSIWGFVDSGDVIIETNEANNVAVSNYDCLAQPGQFNPVVEWNKREFSVAPESNQVMMTPAVIDLNEDGIPDVVFSTFTGSEYKTNGLLRAISGADGSELWSVTDPAYEVIGAGSVTVGDIDNDNQPEIIAAYEEGGLIAFEHDGAFKWKSDPIWGVVAWGASALADLDQDGTTEIIVGGTVLDNESHLLWRGDSVGGIGRGGSAPLSIVADLDLDGRPEVVAGKSAYHADGSLYWNSSISDGFPSIGNFDDDPNPEIVVVAGGQVYLLEHTGDIKWGGLALPGVGAGGAPTIADMDGDGEPEIGVAQSNYYTVLEADGSIKWQQPTQDKSSSITGSSVFDFDGDGQVEVIYGDELALRIYNGTDGEVLYELPKGSGTTMEIPVIADVDADGNAEIVAIANDYAFGEQRGIYVIGDLNDTWVSTRQIWNQHSYHITNINDDGTIPAQEQNSWEVHNTYRLNTQTEGNPLAAPDLIPSYVRLDKTDEETIIKARIGNGGAQFVASGVNVAFFNGNPKNGGELLGATQTTTRLDVGLFEDVALSVPIDTIALDDIWVVADDNGRGRQFINECDEENNAYTASDPIIRR